MFFISFPIVITQHIFRGFEDPIGHLLYCLSLIIEAFPLIIDIFAIIEEFFISKLFIDKVGIHSFYDLIIIIYVILIPKIAISKRLKGLRVRNRKPLCSKEYASIGTPIITINIFVPYFSLNFSSC